MNLFLPSRPAPIWNTSPPPRGRSGREGASAVTIVDSQGVAIPAAMRYLVNHLKSVTNLEVEVHCHNDFGLAVANVLGGYEGGADVLQVSVNGIGYRAGNALHGIGDHGVGGPLRGGHWCAARRLRTIPPGGRDQRHPQWLLQPIVGEGAFRYEQWSATKAFIEGGARPYAFPSNQRWWGAHRNWSSASGATAAR
ncbi:MAG: hypothetical protein R2856_22725 [Caldilineaceae bacterium]